MNRRRYHEERQKDAEQDGKFGNLQMFNAAGAEVFHLGFSLEVAQGALLGVAPVTPRSITSESLVVGPRLRCTEIGPIVLLSCN